MHTVLVHQRAIGKYHSMPQKGVRFTEWQLEENLQNVERRNFLH